VWIEVNCLKIWPSSGLRVPYKVWNFVISLAIISFLKISLLIGVRY